MTTTWSVLLAGDGGPSKFGAALEIRMGGIDSIVNDINGDTLSVQSL
jgi:hypothetical protein